MKIGQRPPPVLAPAKGEGELPLEDHLQAILDSAGFQKAQSLRSLLVYLWEHRGEAISEYALATDALGKRPDFDPKIDATVRVKISRLRQKLKEYYENEGAESEIQSFIPLGGHELQIERKPVAAVKAAPETPRRAVLLLASACGLLAILCGFLYWENLRLKASSQPGGAGKLPAFWQHFFGNGKPASLFLPTPVFFEWTSTRLKARDPVINDFNDFSKSPGLMQLMEKFGPPKLLQNYTVASDSFGALRLAQYLAARDVTISVAGTADLALDSAGDQNIILIGVAGTSRQLDELLTRTNFYCAVGASSIVLNRNPLRGEPSEYRSITASDIRRTVRGIISVLPGNLPGTRLLLMTGNSTYPLTHSLITPASLRAVESIWQKAGSPEFFEIVLNAEVEGRGSTVLRIWPEVIRQVDPNSWK